MNDVNHAIGLLSNIIFVTVIAQWRKSKW